MLPRPPQAIMVNPTMRALQRLESALANLESLNRQRQAAKPGGPGWVRVMSGMLDAVDAVGAAYRDYRLTL